MFYRKWQINEYSPRQIQPLKDGLGAGSLLAKVLLSRGVYGPRQAREKYLESSALSDPFLMKDMDKAVERIHRAIEGKEKIVVYGDYDVDGVCATAVLFSYLESAGANVFYKLPNREKEGYGLNSRVLEKLKEKGVDLVITVDNGIAATEQVEFARSIGLDIVITDHHLPKEQIPDALAVVDPLQPGDNSPFKSLAGVGVAFKLVCALEGAPCEEMLDYYADYVGVGTVADLMLLEGENRTFVKAGLEMLADEPRCGFAALLKISGLGDKQVTSENIAYTIAPRINAAGRMGDATDRLELLLCENEEDADKMARFLEEENRRRQAAQNKIAEEITSRIAADREFSKDRVIVVRGEDYHPGVVGIVASRLVELYAKPAIVFTKDGEDDNYKGSGRSVPVFNLNNALANTSRYLTGFGGHELAAGLSAKKENIEPFRKAINEFAMGNEDMAKAMDLNVDCLLDLDEINVESVLQIDFLAPFGNGNESPLFAVKDAVITAVYPVSDGKHMRIKFRQGNNYAQGIMFNMPMAAFAYKIGDHIDICFSLSVYRGDFGQSVSMKIKEIRPSLFTDNMVDEYNVYGLFLNEFPLTQRQKSLIRPDRNQTALIWRKIASEKVNGEDLRPLFVAFKDIGAGRIRVILDVLLDLGLIEKVVENGGTYFRTVKTEGKKDLMSSAVLQALQ